MATHSSVVARKFHRRGSLGGFSPWDHRVGHGRATEHTSGQERAEEGGAPSGSPQRPRQRRTGEEGRCLHPHAGPCGPGAGARRQGLFDQLYWERRRTAWRGTERSRLPDSGEVAPSTHDRPS